LFKLDKKELEFEQNKSEFEIQLCESDDHLIGKMYKLLLKGEMVEEQVKDCMVKWAKNIGHNIQMQQWEDMWTKGLKFTLCYNLKENFYKMMYRWYMTPQKLVKMYGNVSNLCWKCKTKEGSFYHMWWTCVIARKFWTQIHSLMQSILQTRIPFKPEVFLLGILEEQMEKSSRRIMQYMVTAARLIYAQNWKTQKIPTIQDWLIKLMDMAESDKLTCLLKENSNLYFLREWKPLTDYLQKAGGAKLIWGFEE